MDLNPALDPASPSVAFDFKAQNSLFRECALRLVPTPEATIHPYLPGILNLPHLAATLSAQADPVSVYIYGRLSTHTKTLLANYAGGYDLDLQWELALDLSTIIMGPSIYDANRFAGVTLRQETLDLLALNPTGLYLERLNRMLLEDAYSGDLLPLSSSLWVFKDNFFDKVAFEQYPGAPLDHDYNGYVLLDETDRLSPAAANDRVLTSAPTYYICPLGSYYRAPSGPLFQTGSRTAAEAGLAQYTIQPYQTKNNAGSPVSIGLHYVATASYSSAQPKDTDSDGIPDYVEDANGDGQWDEGFETKINAAYTTTDPMTNDSVNPIYDDVDLDGDGMVGRIEKALGTNPLLPDNPLVLTQLVTSDEPDIVRFTLPINYTALSQVGAISLCADGHSVTLDKCDAATGGNTLLIWNPTYEPPGQRFLNPVLVLHELPANAKVISGVGPIGAYFSANVAQFSTAHAQFDDNGAFLYARLPQLNATYSIDIYDAEDPERPIKTITSGSTSDGTIQENWDLIEDDETTVFSGEKILVAFNVSLLDKPASGRNVQAVNKGTVVVPDGRFDVAFMWHDYALAQPHYGAMWIHMQLTVDTLIAPYFGYDNYQSYFNDYGLTPKPGYVQTRQNALSLLNDLANSAGTGTRNFYFMGHGSPLALSDGLPGPSNAYLRSSEVAASLGNSFDPVDGIKTTHPYRFVFINGCVSALTKHWVRAFGIFPWDDGPIQQLTYRGPQAFVGWRKPVAGPDQASEWNDLPFPASPRKGYGSMIQEFYARWMTERPLIECLERATDPTEYVWPLPVPSNKKRYTKTGDPTDYTGQIWVVGNEWITRSGVAP